ncbi:hypothetical protein BDQ12DRAFT_667865 [Crucibulum laeve]|uniref:DUF6533 domain-containing protein n=1 Tax=Crucibulum laeve TaxID=68775 RepID=A0A5C3LVQ0_9AGAR|nr:hypothetical protein BDQ12DRAFT_667865 [Crucibulum laeve]
MPVNQASTRDSAMTLNTEIAQALYVQEWSTLGALVIIIWDMLLLFNDEYIHIWSAPSFALKWIYIFARYFTLLFQSISYYIITHTLSQPPISWSTAITLIMTAVIEGVLMLRVYALYSQDAAAGWLLIAVFLMQRVISVVLTVCGREDAQFDEICRAKSKDSGILIFGGGVLVTQVVIWTMTFNKRNIRTESRSNSRFVRLLLRDGAWAFGGIIALYSVIIPYFHLVEISSHVVYTWPISLLSIAGLKDVAIANPSVPRDPDEIELPEFLDGS